MSSLLRPPSPCATVAPLARTPPRLDSRKPLLAPHALPDMQPMVPAGAGRRSNVASNFGGPGPVVVAGTANLPAGVCRTTVQVKSPPSSNITAEVFGDFVYRGKPKPHLTASHSARVFGPSCDA